MPELGAEVGVRGPPAVLLTQAAVSQEEAPGSKTYPTAI